MESVPEVVSQIILRYLDHKDVLSLRLLDHCWRRRCTNYLRVNRNILTIRFPHCSHLTDINSMLENAIDDTTPFIGISFLDLRPSSDAYCKEHCSLLLDQDVESLYPYIFQNVVVNYFHIKYITRQTCIADKVLQRLLVSRGGSIKSLWVQNLPTSITSMIEYLGIKSDSAQLTKLFSSLEAMKYSSLPEKCDPQKWEKELIYEILNLSPNLSSCDATLKFRTVLKGKHDVMNKEIRVFKTLLIEYMDPNTTALEYLITKNVRFSTFVLSPPGRMFATFRQRALNCEHFNKLIECVSIIGNKCDTTVSSIYNYFFMNLLYSLSTGGTTFVNLRELHLMVVLNKYAEVHWLCLQSINYEQFCPNLTSVEFSTLECHLIHPNNPEKIEDFSLVGQIHNYQNLKQKLNSIPKYRCLSARSLELNMFGYVPNELELSIWQFMSNIFPNVRDLKAFNRFASDELVENVDTGPWKTSVTCLTYNFIPLDFTWKMYNFCVGIDMEELANLKLNRFDSLKNWSFAPQRKTFENTAVRKVKIKLLDHSKCDPNVEYPDSPLLEHIDVIGRWFRTKLPGFEVEVNYTGECDANCNPLRLDLWKDHATLHRKFRKGSPVCTLRFGESVESSAKDRLFAHFFSVVNVVNFIKHFVTNLF